MNYGNSSQRYAYGVNLASVEAMMIELGLEIPKHSISDTFRDTKTVGKWDRPKVYEPNKY